MLPHEYYLSDSCYYREELAAALLILFYKSYNLDKILQITQKTTANLPSFFGFNTKYLFAFIKCNGKADASAGKKQGRKPAFVRNENMIYSTRQKTAGRSSKKDAKNFISFHRIFPLIIKLCPQFRK